MTSDVQEQWKGELKVLLDRVQTQPSQVDDATRERIAVLNRLIAGEQRTAA